MAQFTQHPLPISPDSPFTIANIPFGIFSTSDEVSVLLSILLMISSLTG